MKTKLLFFIVLLWSPFLRAFSQEIPQISVVGQSQLEVMPDEALLTVSLNAKAMETATATAELNKKARQVKTVLENSGVEDYELTAENYYVNVNRVYAKGSSKDSGYVASQTMEILVRDTGEDLLKVMQALHGSTDMGFQLSYRLSDETKKSYLEKLLEMAIADARRKASVIAANLDIDEVFVHRVNYQGGDSFQPVVYGNERFNMKAADQQAPPTLQPGEQTLTERVTIIFTFER
ncbi:SIMPL domain-containing protein [Cyclobacterium salsum]|uniref:SIMPL domain-containing protein n=1 Tax=Cyclobacterium salsum TaxID=2666329 RepID=UPI00139177D6|nr:SIMPL domain-containing protein [Cyclobacterium salsum]